MERPIDASDLERCPWLCSIPFVGGPIIECSETNITGQSNLARLNEATCQKCGPLCNSSLASSTVSPTESSGFNPSTISQILGSHGSTIYTPSAISRSVSSTTASPTCTSVIPGADTPATVDHRTGFLSRSHCGLTPDKISECPFICRAGQAGPYGKHTLRQCFHHDMTGQAFRFPGSLTSLWTEYARSLNDVHFVTAEPSSQDIPRGSCELFLIVVP